MFSIFKKRSEKETNKPSRADAKLQQEVERIFLSDPYLKDHNITIDVREGEVTLVGTVTAPLLQDHATETAAAIPGVLVVHNRLELGTGRPGEALPPQDLASDDVRLSEASNTAEPNLHHPSTTAFTEVRPQTISDVTGGTDTGITADEAAQMPILNTGEGSSVMDASAVDAMRESGEEQDEDYLMRVLAEGMAVVDREGRSIGRIKEVRTTDFLLNRPLARDVYVPYFESRFDGEQVVVNVLADEIKDQGWASPRPY